MVIGISINCPDCKQKIIKPIVAIDNINNIPFLPVDISNFLNLEWDCKNCNTSFRITPGMVEEWLKK